MPAVAELDLAYLDVLSAEFQDDPHGCLRAARQQGWLARSPFGLELLGYPQVQVGLRDRRFRSPAGLTLAIQGITEGPLWDRVIAGILSIDGEDHTRLRRLVGQAFTPRSADQLRDSMRRIFTDLVASAETGGQCDLVTDVCQVYPIAVICELLGAPAADWPQFSHWADDAFKIFQLNVAEDGPAIERAFDELDAYLEDLIVARRADPGDDLLSAMIAVEDAGDRLTHAELLMMASAVLLAGTDTTRNQLAAAVEVLCAHPEQWTLLRERPELIPQAVEETMRFAPAILGTARVPSEDVEIDGVVIPGGTFVGLTTAAANRDPAVFTDPDRFDVTRSSAQPMLTFGGGIHYCLGVHLAKAELVEALSILTQRWATVRVAGPAPWKPVNGITGPSTLPIELSLAG